VVADPVILIVSEHHADFLRDKHGFVHAWLRS